ncbi:replication protein A 70 kDa DNA-binding subunit D-like [Aegilops tauschii subsp. strangulata]|uniref:replication protein A 70 kDa DNA-binding subunit D-like n=1 Tax=Aegilops tauschii subsp. strangulata TaxID=200361 RepID=UPI00098B69BE
MDEAEGGFTPVSQLNPSPEPRYRVRVRISRMWESFNPNNGTVFGLDTLLIDDEGGAMQARVHRKGKKRLEERLIEGKVYTLSDFEVCQSKGNYIKCRNPFMMNIGARTVVDEIDGGVNMIPLHHFDFVDFGDVPPLMGCNNSSLTDINFTDVIGQVVEVWPIQQVPKKLRVIEFCSLRIQDFSGKELDVTLYGKLGHEFYAEKDAKFLCTSTLKEIDCTQGWYYLGCVHCRQSICRDGSEFWCSQCDPVNKKRKRPVLRYKLNAMVEDDTATMNLMIFAEEAQGLIGITAEELLKEITDYGRCTMPAAISDILGSTHTFQVAVGNQSLSFVVKWVLDDDELTLLQHSGSVQLSVQATTILC